MNINSMPFDPLADPDQAAHLASDDAGVQSSRTLDEMPGGLLRAGLAIGDLYEDTNGEGHLREMNIPSHLAVRAVKRWAPPSNRCFSVTVSP